MGALISTIVDGAKEIGEENKKEADDALNALYSLAQTQLELFYSQITNPDFDTKLVPIDKVIDKRNFIYCQTTSSPLDIASIITSTASDFANGDAAKGVAIRPRRYNGRKQSFVANEQLIRLDIMVFAYSFTSKALMDITQYVQGACVVMSSADTQNMDDNTLRVIVQETYQGVAQDEQEKIYAQLVQALGQKTEK